MRRVGGHAGGRQATWVLGTLFFWVSVTSFVLHFTRPVAAVGHMPQLVLQLRRARNPAAVPVDSVLVYRADIIIDDALRSSVN